VVTVAAEVVAEVAVAAPVETVVTVLVRQAATEALELQATLAELQLLTALVGVALTVPQTTRLLPARPIRVTVLAAAGRLLVRMKMARKAAQASSSFNICTKFVGCSNKTSRRGEATRRGDTCAYATTDDAVPNPSLEDHIQYIQQSPPLLSYVQV
jgi:hypothetical protein